MQYDRGATDAPLRASAEAAPTPRTRQSEISLFDDSFDSWLEARHGKHGPHVLRIVLLAIIQEEPPLTVARVGRERAVLWSEEISDLEILRVDF